MSPEKRSSYVKESKKKEEESDEGALTPEKAMEQSHRSMRRATIMRLKETETLAKQLEQQEKDYEEMRAAEVSRESRRRLAKVPKQQQQGHKLAS